MPSITKVMEFKSVKGGETDIKFYDDGSISWLGDADIDADGANGQNKAKAAYTVTDHGSDFLANGGMKYSPATGEVEPKESWYKDIVILDSDGKTIKVWAGGIIASKTAYKWPAKLANDPSAYVDAETIPYICVPPQIIQATPGVVKGCKAVLVNTKNGKSVEGMVGDIEPRNKLGEISIAAALALEINADPRNGGTEEKIIQYTIYPDTHAIVNGSVVPLMRASGTYVIP